MSVLGDRLKSEREGRGWTKKFAASKLGLKQVSTYANYEYGIRDPDTDMLARMAQLYDTTIDYLKGLSDLKQPREESSSSEQNEKLLRLVKKLGIDLSKPGSEEILEDYLRMFVKHHQR